MTETQHPAQPKIVPAEAIPLEHLDPDALKVVRRLKECGQEAYLVGGCVRDLLLGKTPKDFDVATGARPRQVRRFFRNCRIIGRRFKLAHIVFPGRKIIETATFRKSPDDPASPEDRLLDEVPAATDNLALEPENAQAAISSEPQEPAPSEIPEEIEEQENDLLITDDNVFGNAEQDARRRDFTINALFYDPDRRVVLDYVGGVEDLERRVIRTIGDPWVRFREDPVRILRAVKFATRLGFTIDPAALDAMKGIAPDLSRSAPPRILEEILRLLRSGHAADSFRLLREIASLGVILPELESFLGELEKEGEAGAPHLHSFWKILEGLDALVRSGQTPSTALALACLFFPSFRHRLERSTQPVHDLGRLANDIFLPLARRARISRFDSGRLQRICVAQRRFSQKSGRRFRPNHFVRMDYFPESMALFRIRTAAEGLDPQNLERWIERAKLPLEPERSRERLPANPGPGPATAPGRQERGDSGRDGRARTQSGQGRRGHGGHRRGDRRGPNLERPGQERPGESRVLYEPPRVEPPKRDPDDPNSLLREEERDPSWGDW